jgi:hypothetical protein
LEATNSSRKLWLTVIRAPHLGDRLATLISVRTEKGEEDIPLVPLPVKLFVEQAVQIVREGKDLDEPAICDGTPTRPEPASFS